MTFRTREQCVCCGSSELDTVWSGRFSDPFVAENLRRFHYNADLATALGDQPFVLMRCRGCGMQFHRLVMSDEWIPVLYSEWTDESQVRCFEAENLPGSADRFAIGTQLTKTVLRLRHLLAGRFAEPCRLLDFGCGDGKLLAVADLFGFDAVGIDISASRTERASRRGCPVYPDLETFDAKDGAQVQAVVLSQVLEHVMDPLGLLRAVARRMAAGGVAMIAVPNCSGITVPRDFDQFHHVQPLEHVNAFTPETLREIARRSGFTPLPRPSAYVTTNLKSAVRSAGNVLYQPATTDQFFRLG